MCDQDNSSKKRTGVMISIFSFLLVRKHDRNVPENFAMEEGIEIFEVNDGMNRNDT